MKTPVKFPDHLWKEIQIWDLTLPKICFISLACTEYKSEQEFVFILFDTTLS